ncbi:uncharacterized protein TrAtP1_000844 [Trichoderma atroviride]|uniref:uncharacterized protein n=1 Tax=Hypocrea atroviridis TaxID=63577 RepID=UPI00331F98A6|nr:hypothetical protein TrAtP1_000844 [Trichoderma atroviride]
MEPAPAGSSPGVSSTPATTVISPCSTITAGNASTSTGTSTDGRMRCDHCTATFEFGTRGRKGQEDHLLQHIKRKHPEMVPNQRGEIYKCRYNCGLKSIYKRSIKKHEAKHCAVKKKHYTVKN